MAGDIPNVLIIDDWVLSPWIRMIGCCMGFGNAKCLQGATLYSAVKP